LSYVVRLNDVKTAQHLRARLALFLRRQGNLAKPLRHELKELLEISGLWCVTLATVTTPSDKSGK